MKHEAFPGMIMRISTCSEAWDSHEERKFDSENRGCDSDTLVTKYQNPQREKVNKWLSDLNESSLSPPDIIKISNHRGEIVKMY